VSLAARRFAKGLSSALVVALLVSTAATAPVRSEDQPVIPVLVKDQSAYWKTVLARAEAAGRELKVKVVGKSPLSEQDAAGEIALIQETMKEIQETMKEKPATIVIAPTRSAPEPAIDATAKQAPVVVIDSSVASLDMKATLSTDNVQGGRLAADALPKAIAEKYQTASGEVAIVNYLSGAGSVTERSNGLKDQLFAKYPHLSVVDERDGNGTNAAVEQNAASILQSRPNLRGLFAANGSNKVEAQSGGSARRDDATDPNLPIRPRHRTALRDES
jgi:ribose transport system substrate-binding protein